jgi:hypothetical protein
MERFIGLDAHTQTCTLAVIGPSGKRLHEQVLATDAQMLRAAIEKIGGRQQAPAPIHPCRRRDTRPNCRSR